MKRIILMLTVAAFMVAAMAVSAVPAFADPDCTQVPNNKNCQTTTTNPGGVVNSPSCDANRNPNCETDTTFKGRPQG